MAKPEVTKRTPAGDDHEVVSVTGGNGQFRRRPCGPCPWVKDNAGDFPAEAFRVSAHTANDQAIPMFGCHESDHDRPVTCAGFLLRGADHNLSVRMKYATGQWVMDEVCEDDRELFDDYVDMAVGNGVPEDDPSLADCRRAHPDR